MDDYVGKTDRELLVEIYTELKHTNATLLEHDGCIEALGGEIEEVKSDINKSKGGLIVLGTIGTFLTAKVLGFLKLLGL